MSRRPQHPQGSGPISQWYRPHPYEPRNPDVRHSYHAARPAAQMAPHSHDPPTTPVRAARPPSQHISTPHPRRSGSARLPPSPPLERHVSFAEDAAPSIRSSPRGGPRQAPRPAIRPTTSPVRRTSAPTNNQGPSWRQVRSLGYPCRQCGENYTGQCQHEQHAWDAPVALQFGLPSPPLTPPRLDATLPSSSRTSPASQSTSRRRTVEDPFQRKLWDLQEELQTYRQQYGGPDPIAGLDRALLCSSGLLRISDTTQKTDTMKVLNELTYLAIKVFDRHWITPPMLCALGSAGANTLSSYTAFAARFLTWTGQFDAPGRAQYNMELSFHLNRLWGVIDNCTNACRLDAGIPTSQPYSSGQHASISSAPPRRTYQPYHRPFGWFVSPRPQAGTCLYEQRRPCWPGRFWAGFCGSRGVFF